MWWGFRGYEFPVIGKNSLWHQLYEWLLPTTRENLEGVNSLLEVWEMLLESAWLDGKEWYLYFVFPFYTVSNLPHKHKHTLFIFNFLISTTLWHSNYIQIIQSKSLESVFYLGICYLFWASVYLTKYYCCLKVLHFKVWNLAI